MPRKLSETRIRILRRLAERNLDRDGAETASEIAIGCGERHRASQWAGGNLRDMASGRDAAPLVIRAGTRPNKGSPVAWTITDAGREALAEAEKA